MQNSHISDQGLQEDVSVTGIVMDRSTVDVLLKKHYLHGRVIRHKLHLDKPEEFWNQILVSDESLCPVSIWDIFFCGLNLDSVAFKLGLVSPNSLVKYSNLDHVKLPADNISLLSF